MALLKVATSKPFPFQGKTLTQGAEVESRNWPHIDSRKWAQLIEYGYFRLVDEPGGDMKRALAARAAMESARARETLGVGTKTEVAFTEHGAVDVPVVESPVKVNTHTCADCGFVGKSEHGLKVHRGRSHKE